MRISLVVVSLFLVCALEDCARAQVSCPSGLPAAQGCGGGTSFLSQLPPGAIGVWTGDTFTGAGRVVPRSPPGEDGIRVDGTLTHTLVADIPQLAQLAPPIVPPRTTITNQIKNGPADPNLLSGPRRLFNGSNIFGWAHQGFVTVTDANQPAADGSNDASTATSSVSSWFISPFGASNIPAGTYTVGICVRYGGSGPTSFNLGEIGAGLGSFNATSSWQRFSRTFTTTGAPDIRFGNSSAVTQTLLFIDYELFAGSSDLHSNCAVAPNAIINGDLIVGYNAFDSTSAVSGGAFQRGGSGLISLATATTPSTAFTVSYVAKRTGAPTNSTLNAILSVADSGTYGDWFNIAIGPALSANAVGALVNNLGITQVFNGTGSPQLTSSLWGDAGGTAVFTLVYDGTESKGFINNVKFFNYSPVSVAAVSVSDMAVGVIYKIFFGANDIYQIIYWPRALSDAEVLAAYNVQSAKTALTIPRAVAFDGTSITAGAHGISVPFIIGPNLNPPANGASYAVSGSILKNLSDRAANIDAILNGAPPQTFILSVEAGTNDLGLNESGGNKPYTGNPNAFTRDLATYLDARRAAGWKTVCHTILAALDATDGGTQFLSDRAIANATIRTWVGTHCDALADWASDPTMGTDTAPNNTTYWAGDKLHPNSAGYLLMEPYDRAAINGL
jgi:hypothetical protein